MTYPRNTRCPKFISFKSVGVLLVVSLFFIFGACQKKEFSNSLIHASSPYLREHADNPVDWQEWSDRALEKAKLEDKPIIISIGYASCHWCHVMEEESFMDTAVARIMNENFVSIKIDREERPDIDQVYIAAAQLISGNAGWPLNAFALPDGKPFYAGTYFTKEQWLNLMKQILNTYREDNNAIVKQANAITRGILVNEVIKPAIDTGNSFSDAYENIFPAWEPQLDLTSGGLTGAPKFPLPVVWEFLLQDYYQTKNQKALGAVTTTLDKMAKGGIYDHLAGGFARYSTDADWKVPHFEKMLYDNGQLVSVYAHGYAVTKKDDYADVVTQTLNFVKNELTSSEGGFYSSLNADSEGGEGTFYVWRQAEIESELDKRSSEIIIDLYNITSAGNWEKGKNVLYRKSLPEELAKKHNTSVLDLEKTIATSNAKLLEARNKRIHPSLDDKILTAWNALMLSGYVDAYWSLGKSEYLAVAITNAEFLKKNMLRDGGQLWRSYSNGKASIDAFLDDYALLTHAYIKLYQATFDKKWLDLAKSMTDYVIANFQDSQSGFFYYAPPSSQLVVRKMEIADQVIPSSNSVMAEVLLKLGLYYSDDSYLSISSKMVGTIANDSTKYDPYYANWASLIGMNANSFYEVAIMGDQHTEMSKELMKNYLPNILLMGGASENLPLLENKLVAGKTIIYVCQDKVCKLPVTEVEKALEQLKIKHSF